MSEAVKASIKKPEAKKEHQVSQVQKSNFQKPFSSPVEQILFLQRTAGNKAVQKFMKSGWLQAKLRIGEPGDLYEQEANRVADQVMRMPCVSKKQNYAGEIIQCKCPTCEEEIQRNEAAAMQPERDAILQAGDIKLTAPAQIQAESDKCVLPYDSSYEPSSSNCAVYQGTMAKRFLTWTYRHNATCACENTPNDPKNNCIRKCLQVKMAAFLSRMSSAGAVIGTCLDPIGILDFTCPEPYCSDLYDQHVECYKECCCQNDFIGYPAFWFMCEAPYPCSFVSFTISKFNSCD